MNKKEKFLTDYNKDLEDPQNEMEAGISFFRKKWRNIYWQDEITEIQQIHQRPTPSNNKFS